MCVETLKRDWKPTLTLRDVLVTISGLLVYPNASSALNAEAGGMLESGGGEGWEGFERRARLMTRLQAGVPNDLVEEVRQAQGRGEDREKGQAVQKETTKSKEKELERQELERKDSGFDEGTPADSVRRRRRGVGRMREVMSVEEAPPRQSRQRTPSPVAASPPAPSRRPPARPFVVQSALDDVFGSIHLPHPSQQTPQLQPNEDLDSSLFDLNQENSGAMPPPRWKPSLHTNPTRHGPAIPLSELSIASPDLSYAPAAHPGFDVDTSLDDSMESEYPPSPRKSPVKQRPRNTSGDYYAEHPPSPRKQLRSDCPPNPRKQSPVKQLQQEKRHNFLTGSTMRAATFAPPLPTSDMFRAESSRTRVGSSKPLFFTPDNAEHPAMTSTMQGQTPDLAHTETDESEFEVSFEVLRQSERKRKNLLSSPPKRKVRTFLDKGVLGGRSIGRALGNRSVTPERDLQTPTFASSATSGFDPSFGPGFGLGFKQSDTIDPVVAAPASIHKSPKTAKIRKSDEQKKRERLERHLWKMCGEDVEKWNKGDFGGFLKIKASRW